MPDAEPPRWLYRLDNFERAYQLLAEAIDAHRTRSLSSLEKEGIIQRFEYSWELGWKLLKDYLQHNGITLETVTPRTTLRAALEARLIHDGDGWMAALEARNHMSHSYNAEIFERIIRQIDTEYFALLTALYDTMCAKRPRNA